MGDFVFIKNDVQDEDSGSITREQFIQRALISEEDINQGHLSRFEDVIIESEDW